MNTGTGQQNGWVLTVTPRVSIWPTSLGPNILYWLLLKGTGNAGLLFNSKDYKMSTVEERWGRWLIGPDPGPVAVFVHHFPEGPQLQVTFPSY